MTLLPSILAGIDRAVAVLASVGAPLGWMLVAASMALVASALVPQLFRFRGAVLGVTTVLLAVGEALLAWFHWQLWRLTAVIDPATNATVGRVAVPLWVESEKLYVWALVLAVMALLMRRHRDEMLAPLLLVLAALTAGSVLSGRPFTEPIPSFLGQYRQYAGAMLSGVPQAAFGAFQGMRGSMQYYYNAWYMWVHPPLLFLSYGAFVVSFVASMLMVLRRSSAYETTAYRWARFGYLPLTAGMLLGFPWAILAWQGESWWWSGKVNMSIMMWLLYTAYLHGRLYLRKRGMWKLVAALAILSFTTLVLTYLTTYIVPGAHSVAGG